jgi:hypothetical protein
MFHRVQSTMPLSDDKNEDLHEEVEVSRREAEFQRRTGELYDHGDGSGVGGGGVRGFFRRATSQRERSREFDTARATAPVQTQIDIDPWTSKRNSAKEAIGRAWSKWFHISGIPSRNAVFISAVKQTQQPGK